MDIPSSYQCPLSLELMRDPVFAVISFALLAMTPEGPLLNDELLAVQADGQTYERSWIEEWLARHETSPLTNARLPNKTLTPNIALRCFIEDWSNVQTNSDNLLSFHEVQN